LQQLFLAFKKTQNKCTEAELEEGVKPTQVDPQYEASDFNTLDKRVLAIRGSLHLALQEIARLREKVIFQDAELPDMRESNREYGSLKDPKAAKAKIKIPTGFSFPTNKLASIKQSQQ